MKRGKLWKYFLALLLAFSLLLPVYSESSTELEIPDLEPKAEYVMTGQDIMTLYQTINDLNETKNYAKTLAQEYEKENKKLTIQNSFLIGTTVCSVSVCVVGVITFMCLNTK